MAKISDGFTRVATHACQGCVTPFGEREPETEIPEACNLKRTVQAWAAPRTNFGCSSATPLRKGSDETGECVESTESEWCGVGERDTENHAVFEMQKCKELHGRDWVWNPRRTHRSKNTNEGRDTNTAKLKHSWNNFQTGQSYSNPKFFCSEIANSVVPLDSAEGFSSCLVTQWMFLFVSRRKLKTWR